MCGRYTLRRINLKLAMEAILAEYFEEFSERARFNVAPSQAVPFARLDGEGRRVLSVGRWGLIPSWTKCKPKFAPINARAESVNSGMFRDSFQSRRCLIPADGFYEWMAIGPKVKQPYFFHFKDDRLFAFGGFWDVWKPAADVEAVQSCATITTTPNEVSRPIHDRMPVIIRREDYGRWLDPETPMGEVEGMLGPFPGEEMEAYAVGAGVGRATNEGPGLIERLK